MLRALLLWQENEDEQEQSLCCHQDRHLLHHHFIVTYEDGHVYEGTYSLGKFDYGDLAGHMRSNLNARAQIGLDVPTLTFIRSIDRDGSQRRAALEFLATRKLA